MAYIGNTLDTIVKQGKKAYVYTATSGQTVFTGSDDNGESLDITVDSFANVFLNGIRLIKTDDYTVSTDTITLTSGASLGDELVIVADIESAIYNTYTRSETDAAISPKLDSTTAASTYAPLSGPSFTDYVQIPTLTTTQRNALTPQAGYIVFNTTTATMNQYDGSNWTEMAKPPIISSLSYSGSATAVDPAGGETITITGANFLTGVNVKFGTTLATSVTRVNSTTLTVTTPALTAGDYDVYVVNGDGMQAVLSNGLTSNASPVWTTASGNLGSIQNDRAITTITLVATEDDAGAITYTVTTGALPTGLSISGADIDGTPTGYTAETTVNFTITATDDEGQTADRSFNLIVLVGFYTYEITQSLRFNDDDSAYLSRTPSSAGNRKTWTWSGWVKRGNIASYMNFFGSEPSVANFTKIQFTSSQTIEWISNITTTSFNTTQVFRDASAWYHIVLAFDSTQATSTNRLKLYVNGEQVTSFSSITYPALNSQTGINNTQEHQIGKTFDGYYLDGYLAEVHFTDGTAYDATAFGEFKQGVWVPIAPSVTYGTNGFYLDFDGTYYNDKSGNGNDFTANNLAATDVVPDSTTNKFATLNPLDKLNSPTISEGNLQHYPNGSGVSRSTMGINSGKMYFEICQVSGVSTGTPFIYGLCELEGQITHTTYKQGVAVYNDNGNGHDIWTYVNGSQVQSDTGYFTTTSAGDIWQFAYDADTGKVWIGRNGTWFNSGNPAAGTGYIYQFSNNYTLGPVMDHAGANYTAVLNTGADSSFAGNKTAQNNTDSNGIGDFYYTPPTGFLALCTANITETGFNNIISVKPSDHFNTVLFNGNGGTNAITGLGFQPDFVWVKSRSNAYGHNLHDVIRGPSSFLASHDTAAENTAYTNICAFTSDGFTLSSASSANVNGTTNVGWCWKAGGTSVSNTDGSINSQVSVNTDAGFSVVSYTGNGSSNQTIGHGLSKTPELVISKSRTASYTYTQWYVYHKDMSTNYHTYLNKTNGQENGTGAYFVDNLFSSTVFGVGNDIYGPNVSGDDYIAYCWNSVEGFSKFGSYVANGNADGAFVYTGFNPGLVIIKNISRAQEWVMSTSSVTGYNPETQSLNTNTSNAEGTGNDIDFVSNGFKVRTSGSGINYASGDTMIYMAWAEDPFKYNTAR